MQQCLEAFKAGKPLTESKGVIADPLMQWDPKNVILAFLHCFGGVFNKTFESAKTKLAKVIDEPFMGRSQEAAKMNDRISELDARQRQEAAKIALLQAEHDELQTSLRPLIQYLDKLKGSKGNAVTKALRAEIKGTEKQITEVKKKIIRITADIKQLQQSVKKITAKIKELAGPMSNAVRSALRGLGIELCTGLASLLALKLPSLCPKKRTVSFLDNWIKLSTS